MNHIDYFDNVHSVLKDSDKLDSESIDRVVAENEPAALINKQEVVPFFSEQIADVWSTVLVDVGCFSGKNFTIDFARQNPNIDVLGLDIFSPEMFNKDVSIPYNEFLADAQVRNYLQRGLPKDIKNVEFMIAHFDENFELENLYSSGQKILTGFKTPGKLGVDLLVQAGRNRVDLLVNTPSNLPEMGESDFPISEHGKYRMTRHDLLELLCLKYSMIKTDDGFVPKEKQDKLNYLKSKLAKLIVCIDRARYLEERGLNPAVIQYNDSFGWGNNTPEHLIYASHK